MSIVHILPPILWVHIFISQLKTHKGIRAIRNEDRFTSLIVLLNDPDDQESTMSTSLVVNIRTKIPQNT